MCVCILNSKAENRDETKLNDANIYFFVCVCDKQQQEGVMFIAIKINM